MERLRIALCDDDGAFRSLMRPAVEAALRRNGISAEFFEACDAGELSAAIGHMSFELIFLDIDMPGMDGVRFGEQLRGRGCRSDIIYVSNMDDKVYDIFRVHPWSFIRKSRFSDELGPVIDEYVRTRRSQAERLLFTGGAGQSLSVDPRAVMYVEAAGKNQKLCPAERDEPLLVRVSMHELEAMLVPFGFIRIHKGFLVNYRYIRKITSRGVLLDGGGDLPVGRDRLAPARERYLELMRWKGLGRL